MATIIDLKSGDPRLIIDTGMKIDGLGVTGNTVIVVGGGKIITWDLPAEHGVLEARANIRDSIRTIMFNHPALPPTGREEGGPTNIEVGLPGTTPKNDSLPSASISPDFNYVVITWGAGEGLDIYDISTGKHLARTTTGGYFPWFTLDGREVWSSRVRPLEGWKITKDTESDAIRLEHVRSNILPSGGFPWRSPHGHNVTKGGWIFNSRKKRLMWLPHHWRKYERYWMWDGQFLGLLDPGLPEPFILELDE